MKNKLIGRRVRSIGLGEYGVIESVKNRKVVVVRWDKNDKTGQAFLDAFVLLP